MLASLATRLSFDEVKGEVIGPWWDDWGTSPFISRIVALTAELGGRQPADMESGDGRGFTGLRRSGYLEVAALGGLCALLFWLAWPGMNSEKLLDDTLQWSYVQEFDGWRDCLGPDSFGMLRPFKNLFFYGVLHLGPGTPPLFHGITILLHFVACAAVYAFLKELLGCRIWPGAATAIWALSPTQVSTAIWASCANISLSVAFLCGYLICHRRLIEAGRLHVGISLAVVLTLALALFSYEGVIAAVGLAWLCDQLKSASWSRTRSEIGAYVLGLAVTFGFLALRVLVDSRGDSRQLNLGFPPDTERWQLAVSASWLLWRHLSMWLWPSGRLEFASSFVWGGSVSPAAAIISWLLLVGAAAAVVTLWRRFPLACFGLAWFALAIFPTSNFVPIFSGPVEDYYVVVPGIGLAIAVTGMLQAFWRLASHPSAAGPAKAVGWCLLVGIAGWRLAWLPTYRSQAGLWAEPERLYQAVIESRPHQYLARHLRASALLQHGAHREALELAKAAQLDAPWFLAPRVIEGMCLSALGENAAAEEVFGDVLRDPAATTAERRTCLRELAQIDLDRKDYEKVIERTAPLLEDHRHPHYLPAVFFRIDAFRNLGREEEMREIFKQARDIYPEHPILHLFSGMYQTPPAPSAGAPSADP